MSEENIEKFNTYTAKIFDQLYSNFPKDSNTNYSEITGEQNKEQLDIFMGTMKFLTNEGYIINNGHTLQGDFNGVVLTAKGLSILGAVPKAIDEKESFIEKIRKALAGGGKEATKAAVQGLINYSISTLTTGNPG